MATQAKYTLNSSQKPIISHDNGFLDKFTARKPTSEEERDYLKWRGKLELGEAIQGVPFIPKNDLPDALAAYRHFLEGSGKPRDVKIGRYLKYDISGRKTLANAAIEAQNAAFDLYTRKYNNKNAQFTFAGSALSAGGSSILFPYPATENWQKAIGAFKFWITGKVTVHVAKETSMLSLSHNNSIGSTDSNKIDVPEFDLLFSFHMEDRYNFNPGQKDIATGIPDSENGTFEITGLAKQYINQSSANYQLAWKGSPPSMPKPQASNGMLSRSLRQPSDNRRVRNRI